MLEIETISSASELPSQSQRAMVLVVDDDRDARFISQEYLTLMGVRVLLEASAGIRSGE